MASTTVLSGLFWVSSVTLGSRALGLLSQVVLGFYLSAVDYGLFAITLSAFTILDALRNGGVQRVLIQRGEDYQRLSLRYFQFSLLFNFILVLCALGLGVIAARVYDDSQLRLLIPLMALSVFLGTPAVVARAKLSIEHRFKENAFVTLASNISRQVFIMVLAVMGFGALSFVIPMSIAEIVTFGAVILLFGGVPKFHAPPQTESFAEIFRATKWIMYATAAIAIGKHGQHFVIGLFEGKQTLGFYFFAMQFITAVSVVFTNAIESVIFPALSRQKSNVPFISECFNQGLSLIVLLIGAVSVCAMLLSGYAIECIWGKKWLYSIPLVESLALMLPALLIISTCRATIESLGLWRDRMIWLSLFAVGDLLTAALTATLSSIEVVAFMTLVYRTLFSLMFAIYVSQILDCSVMKLVRNLAYHTTPIGLGIVSIVLLGRLEIIKQLPQPIMLLTITGGFLVTVICVSEMLGIRRTLIHALNRMRGRGKMNA